jgi:predicted Zn-dependent protease
MKYDFDNQDVSLSSCATKTQGAQVVVRASSFWTRVRCRCVRWRPVLLAFMVAFMFSGCATNYEPVTGRSQFILTNPQTEAQMGLEAWKEIRKEEELSTHPEYNAAVRRVGQNIARVVEQPGFEWEFRLFKSEQANAFCLPGGKVGVYKGLFKYAANDAELAAVVGHEIGHAIARHGGERMTQGILVNAGAAGLSIALNDKEAKERQKWLLAYTGLSTVGVILPYSRKQEYAADEIGLLYMARAGYNPEAALSFWKKFGSERKSVMDDISEFLSTHPIGEKRLDRLRNMLPRAMAEYSISAKQYGLGVKYKRTGSVKR